MDLPELAKLAVPVGDQIPDVFLGEFVHFNWRFEECVLPSGADGIRFVFSPAMLPFLKFSLPFHPNGLRALRDDINQALHDAATETDPAA